MDNKTKQNNFGSTLKTIFWVLRLVYSFSPVLIIAVIVVQIFITVVPFAEQKYISNLIDNLIKSYSSNSNIWVNTFLIFLLIRGVKILFFNLNRLFQRLLDFRVSNEIRKFYINKTSSLDYQQFEDEKIATLMAKVNEEYGWRTRQIITDIFNLINQLISLLTVIILLLPKYWYIALLLLIGEIPSLLFDKKFQKINWLTFNHYNEKTRPGWDAAHQLTDKKYTAELKINAAVDWLKSKFVDIQDEFTQARSSIRRQQFFPDLAASVVSIITGGLCLYFIIHDINLGLLSIGMFTFYFSIIRGTGDTFSGILSSYISISEQVLHIDNFRKIVELPKIIIDGNIKKGIITSPIIEFKNVSFKYPSTEKYIYQNLNLTIKSGEEIAIVGPNGAGKSTLIKLLCRFYDPTEGEILINGIDLKKYNNSYWYQKLSLLTQEFNIYKNLSLRENVSIGKSIDDRKIISALKKSEAYNFVKSYKNGLDTMMSQRFGGIEPSWGQWQKIAIARVFYRNTPLLILDEPTASIDAVSESKIFSRLYKQIKKQTLIIVSHRFSTVRNAQRIIVIDKGKIIEQGTHQELLTKKGLYAKSFNLQAKGYN